MKRFKNILFYIDGMDGPTASLQRAVNLAEFNQARLTLIDVIQPVDTPAEIKSRFKLELTDLLSAQRKQALEDLSAHVHQDDRLIYTKVLQGQPFVEIIKFILQGNYDLLMKVANAPTGVSERLFGGQDLHLLRKCPCPVLIDRPGASAQYKRILATVDSGSARNNSCDTLVMDLATSLAHREQAQLHVVQAWNIQGESTLRSGRFRLPSKELEAMLQHEINTQQGKLQQLLAGYDMSAQDEQVHLVKGAGTQSILRVADSIEADIIVMGTLGRVGIPGFFIGNTAEEVLQATNCSILAVKPPGFISPVH